MLELVKQPGNNQCADCKTANPRWASWDQGVFLCVKCASMHRKIGSHVTKVKSLTLDTWTRDQVETMRRLGNVKVNSVLNPDERRNPPPPPDSDDSRNSDLERFVRNKYEYKVYQDFDHPALPSPAPSPEPPNLRSLPPPAHHSGIAPRSNVPPPPRRVDSSQTSYAPPPPPPLPQRTATGKVAKSVRFPTAPPVQIPSPPDSDDDDDSDDDRYDQQGEGRRRVVVESKHRSIPTWSTRSILVRTPSNAEIPIDWAALTSSSASIAQGDDDDEDVPLQALGALGMKGAQVGLVGIPTSSNQPGTGAMMTPIAMYGSNSQGGGGGGGLKPLMPQFTGSAKGYLHQLHAGTYNPNDPSGSNQNQPMLLVPQMTGSVSKSYASQHRVDGDSFMKLFQPPPPPTESSTSSSSYGNPNGRDLYNDAPTTTTMTGVRPSPTPRVTNPFMRFNTQQSEQTQPTGSFSHPQSQPPSTTTPSSIWDDLVSLSPSPSPSPAPPAASPESIRAPGPLRPQVTGFVPSSAFGQQFLSAQNSGRGGVNDQPGPSSIATNPEPLKPQYTGFVPSSSFGQQLAKDMSSAAAAGTIGGVGGDRGGDRSSSPGLFDFDVRPLNNNNPSSQQQQTGSYIPSSGGYNNHSGTGGGGGAAAGRSSSPFGNPFSTFSNSLSSALPASSSSSSAQLSVPPMTTTGGNNRGGSPSLLFAQPTGARGGNPFYFPPPQNGNDYHTRQPGQGQQFAMTTGGYQGGGGPFQQRQQQQQQQGQAPFSTPTGGSLRPQLTGFAGSGSTNPFLSMVGQGQYR